VQVASLATLCATAALAATMSAANAESRLASWPSRDEPTWLTYAALRNDVFTELIPPIDDRGFTHDNVFVLRRLAGDTAFGGGFVHRWLTSTRDRRRWDQLDVFALAERRWPHRVTSQARLGPAFGGNYGGRWMQNGWHALTGSGPTLDEGLANDYPGPRRLGLVAGGAARIDAPALDAGERIGGYAIADGQLAVGGTGVTRGELAVGGTARTRHVGVHAEIAVTRYHVADPYLALPGGYGTGFQMEWRIGVHVAWSRFRVGYEYRANEGGSGEPIGVVAFQSQR
jgi:hypothetical protein